MASSDIALWVGFTGPLLLPLVYWSYKLYCLVRFLWVHLSPSYSAPVPGVIPEGKEPVVYVLIPCYNEAQVIKRTMDAACKIDWPADKLRVRVLDDSNDLTKEIADTFSAEWREQGIDCEVIRRPDRVGYKAGNLMHAIRLCNGDFYAIFDADHRACPDFLRAAMPHFYDENGERKPEIGLVQAPWAYYNLFSNMITQCDGLQIDMQHVIEQRSRSRAMRMFSFNGTGGIWSKEGINAGEGFTWDTVTEDLDISWKACLNGFRMVYVEHIPCGLELPANMAAQKTQKYRWDKGFFQVAVKSLWKLLTWSSGSASIKVEVFFLLTDKIQSPVFLWMLIWMPLLVLMNVRLPEWSEAVSIFILAITFIQVVITVICKPTYKGEYSSVCSRAARVLLLPFMMMMNTGMLVNSTMAVFEGLYSKDATFHRTPKDGASASGMDAEEEEEEEEEGVDKVAAAEGAAAATATSKDNKRPSSVRYHHHHHHEEEADRDPEHTPHAHAAAKILAKRAISAKASMANLKRMESFIDVPLDINMHTKKASFHEEMLVVRRHKFAMRRLQSMRKLKVFPKYEPLESKTSTLGEVIMAGYLTTVAVLMIVMDRGTTLSLVSTLFCAISFALTAAPAITADVLNCTVRLAHCCSSCWYISCMSLKYCCCAVFCCCRRGSTVAGGDLPIHEEDSEQDSKDIDEVEVGAAGRGRSGGSRGKIDMTTPKTTTTAKTTPNTPMKMERDGKDASTGAAAAVAGGGGSRGNLKAEKSASKSNLNKKGSASHQRDGSKGRLDDLKHLKRRVSSLFFEEGFDYTSVEGDDEIEENVPGVVASSV